jgi:hypothetical protein
MKRLACAAAIAFASCAMPGAPPAKVDSMPRLLAEGKVMDLKELAGLLRTARAEGRELRGEGLTVFEGTKIEKFEFEVIDIARNYIHPKHDLILFRGRHPRWLDGGNVIAGMSGSPCYINGRIIGALAYSLGAGAKVPIGGITPIEYMVREMDRPMETGRASYAPDGPQPVMTPVLVRGVAPGVLKRFERDFADRHMLLAAASGGSATQEPPETFQPGSAIGTQLMNGDYDFTGIGTVTLVDGEKVIAFGHPDNGEGEVLVPATTCVIHTSFTGVMRSMKIGSPHKVVGAMVKDRANGIVVQVGKQAKMVPVTITVSNPRVGTKEVVRVNCIDHPTWLALLVSVARSSAIEAFEPSGREKVTVSTVTLKMGARTLKFEDVAQVNPVSGDVTGGPSALSKIFRLIRNEYAKPSIDSIEVDCVTVNEDRGAELKHAWAASQEVADGGEVKIHLVLKKFRGAEIGRDVVVKLPKGMKKGAEVEIRIGGGGEMAPDRAPSSTLEDFLASLQKEFKATQIVAVLSVPSYRMMYRGRIVENLPNTVVASLAPTIEESAVLANGAVVQSFDTEWVVSGQGTVKVRIQ